MAFTKKKRRYKRISRTDADIMVVKGILIDQSLGYKVPTSVYEEQSKKINGK